MQPYKDKLIQIAVNHKNPINRQRAKRALRVRYGVTLPAKNCRDPIWLSAYEL